MRDVLIWIAALAVVFGAAEAGATTLVPVHPPANRVAHSRPSARLAAATKAPHHARVPERTESMNFHNWAVTCQVFSEKPKQESCRAQLRAEQSHSRRIILVWTVFISGRKQPVGVLETLTGVMIAPGVGVHFDGGNAKGKKSKSSEWKFSYQDCEPAHCHAVRTLDSKFIHAASAAATASVMIRAVNGKTLRISFPVKGFGKAYAQLLAAAG